MTMAWTVQRPKRKGPPGWHTPCERPALTTDPSIFAALRRSHSRRAPPTAHPTSTVPRTPSRPPRSRTVARDAIAMPAHSKPGTNTATPGRTEPASACVVVVPCTQGRSIIISLVTTASGSVKPIHAATSCCRGRPHLARPHPLRRRLPCAPSCLRDGFLWLGRWAVGPQECLAAEKSARAGSPWHLAKAPRLRALKLGAPASLSPVPQRHSPPSLLR
jgi:hypothetical protein